MKEVWTRLRNQEVAKERIEPVKLEARQLNGATGNLGQLVFWGFNQQPSGYNGCGAALLVGLWVRPEPFHLRHNGAQRFRRDGHAIGMGYSSHSHGGLAGRQDPVVLRERSHNRCLIISHARRQPGELYSIFECTWRKNTTVGWVPLGHGAIWCRIDVG